MSSFVPLLGAAPSSKPSERTRLGRGGEERRGAGSAQQAQRGSDSQNPVTVRIQAEFRVTSSCGR